MHYCKSHDAAVMLSKETCVVLRDRIHQSVKTLSRTQSMNFWPLDLVHICYFTFANTLPFQYSLFTLNLLVITCKFHVGAIFVTADDNKTVFCNTYICC